MTNERRNFLIAEAHRLIDESEKLLHHIVDACKAHNRQRSSNNSKHIYRGCGRIGRGT